MSDGESPVVCPVCGNLVTPVPIVFGYPTPETFEAAEAGQVELGGCVVTEHDPTHRCPACGSPLARAADDDDEEAGAFLNYLEFDE